MIMFKISSNSILILKILLTHSCLPFCHGVGFHRTTGIVFSVHSSKSPYKTSDSLDDVKAMMREVSGKFSKVLTFGVGALDERYNWNYTYYKSEPQIHFAVAAAHINNENLGKIASPVSVTLGIYQHDNENQLQTEINLALESAKKANSIYPGTVKGIVFSRTNIDFDVDRARQTLNQLNKLKTEANKLGIKLGTRQGCEGLQNEKEEDDEDNDDENNDLVDIKKEIIKQSDFVICKVYPQSTEGGPIRAFYSVKNKVLKQQSDIQLLNPKIEVMGQTGYPARILKQSGVDNLGKYWILCGEFGQESEFNLYMTEAFDNLTVDQNYNTAHMGWWKKMGSNSNTYSGHGTSYVEKVAVLGNVL